MLILSVIISLIWLTERHVNRQMSQNIEFTTHLVHLVHKWLELERLSLATVSLEDQLELIVNNLEKERITRLENHMIVATQLLDHLFHTKTEDKYHLKQTNIILNHKQFYQLNNNKINFTEEIQHHLKDNTVPANNNLEVKFKLQFIQANSQAEVLELNSGDLKDLQRLKNK